MVVAVQRKHPWKQLSSSFEILAMENYLRGLLSELETDMFKKSSTATSRKISSSALSIHDMVLAGPSISLLYYSKAFFISTWRHLLPSEELVLFALYSLLLERNLLLLVMRLSNLLAPVVICFQELTCIELWRQPCKCTIHRARRLHDSRHTQLSTKKQREFGRDSRA